MQTAPKKRLRIVFILFIVVFLLIWLYQDYFLYSKAERLQRSADYHTLGQITLLVDGNPVSPDGVTVQFLNDEFAQEVLEEATITDGAFLIQLGQQGQNHYAITLPASLWGDDSGQEVSLDLAHFSANWWHVDALIITLHLTTTPQLTIEASAVLQTPPGFGFEAPELPFLFEENPKVITPQDRTLVARTQTP